MECFSMKSIKYTSNKIKYPIQFMFLLIKMVKNGFKEAVIPMKFMPCFFRTVNDYFVKWLLKEGKDFAVGSHKEYLPPKRRWILKKFNKNEILNNTSSFLKFKML